MLGRNKQVSYLHKSFALMKLRKRKREELWPGNGLVNVRKQGLYVLLRGLDESKKYFSFSHKNVDAFSYAGVWKIKNRQMEIRVLLR